MDSIIDVIADAKCEYAQHEMEDPVLLDGLSEMHARNALRHLENRQWEEALGQARIAAGQHKRWQRFLEIVTNIDASTKAT